MECHILYAAAQHMGVGLFHALHIQYRYMAPSVIGTAHLDYLREHLRILSGFYCLLQTFDGVTPYQLEMQAKLSVDSYWELYQF